MTTDLTKPIFDAEAALEFPVHLGKRLQESKTLETAEEIEGAMSKLCADLLDYLDSWVKIGKRSSFGEGGVLYWIEQYWDDLSPMHDQYESFHDFAIQETAEEYSTVRAKIGIYRTFILNDKRDAMVSEYGPDAFLDVPIGKLQKALGTVRRERMTQDQWDALMDPNVRDREFYHVMKVRSSEVSNGSEAEDDRFVEEGDPRVVLSMDTGVLRYYPGESQLAVQVGYLDIRSKDETIRQIVDEIVEAAGIRRS